jgi:hypothetical protein
LGESTLLTVADGGRHLATVVGLQTCETLPEQSEIVGDGYSDGAPPERRVYSPCDRHWRVPGGPEAFSKSPTPLS